MIRARSFLLPIVVSLAGIGACVPAPEPPTVNGPVLVEGRSQDAHIQAGETRVFPVHLESGDAVDFEVLQRGVDVTVTLLSPGGEALCRVDSPNGNRGPERLVATARQSGEHRVVVKPWLTEARGPFQVTVHHRGPPRPGDVRRAEACRLGWQADRLAGGQERKDLEEALETYRRVEAAWRQLEEPYLASVAAIEADGARLDLHRYEEVVESSAETLTHVVALEAAELEPALLNQQGLALRRLGLREEAAAAYERVLAVARELGNSREEALALNNLGLVVRARGEPWKAMALFEAALELLRALRDVESEAVALHNLGDLQLWAERREQARESLQRALKLEQDLGHVREQVGTLTSLATVALQADDLDTAFRRLEEAEALARRLQDQVALGVVLDRLGSVRRAAGELEGAAAAYEAALASFAAHRSERDRAETEDSGNQARIHSNLGRVYGDLGRLRKARRLHDRAVATLGRLDDPSSEAAARFYRACLARQEGRLDAAQLDLERALKLSEELRVAAGSQELRSLFFASVQDYFEELVDVHMEQDARAPGQGHLRRAVELAEARRSRSLLDLVDGRRSSVGEEPRRRAHRGELIRELARLRSELLQALARRTPAERLTILEKKIQRLERQKERLDTSAASLAGTEPVSFQEMQAQLDDETQLLVYSLGDERSWAWWVSRDDIQARSLAGKRSIEELALRLHRVLPRSQAPGDSEQARYTAAALAQEILTPFEGALPHGSRLAVLADGALWQVPFAVLPWGETGETLLDHHEVVHVPSVSVLAELRERNEARPRAPRAAAVVADPVFSPADPRVSRQPLELPILTRRGSVAPPNRASYLERLHRLPRLPASRREAEAVLASLAPEERWLAMGFAANRETFLAAPLESSRILHLATHTLLDDAHPDLVGVVLSQVTDTGEWRDGFLHSFEIAELTLATELVVLSACHTGLGQRIRGEGLVGLPQSFFDAGATRVLVSLWSIDDEATARLMEHFYRYLRSGMAPGEALRRAQQDLRRNPRWRAPVYWAPFVLQGDWRRFEF